LQQTKKRKEKKRKKSFHGGNNSHELKLNYGIAPLSRNLKQGFSLGGRKQSICTHLGFHHLYRKLHLDFFFWAALLQDPKLENNWDLDVVNAEEGEEDQLFFQTLNMMQTCGRLVLLSSLEKGKS
jgi:hypothetical protein